MGVCECASFPLVLRVDMGLECISSRSLPFFLLCPVWVDLKKKKKTGGKMIAISRQRIAHKI